MMTGRGKNPFRIGDTVFLKGKCLPALTVVGVMIEPESKVSVEWLEEDLTWRNAWFHVNEVTKDGK